MNKFSNNFGIVNMLINYQDVKKKLFQFQFNFNLKSALLKVSLKFNLDDLIIIITQDMQI